jgi:hydrogenase maturation factor
MAIPGKIVKSDGKKVTVDYGESGQVKASIIDGDFVVGDFVIVQGKIVIEKVPKAQIKKWKDFLKKDYVR